MLLVPSVLASWPGRPGYTSVKPSPTTQNLGALPQDEGPRIHHEAIDAIFVDDNFFKQKAIKKKVLLVGCFHQIFRILDYIMSQRQRVTMTD